MLGYALDTAAQLSQHIVLVASPHSSEAIAAYVGERRGVQIVIQPQACGTGNALGVGLLAAQGEWIAVLLGDVPFVTKETLERALAQKNDLTVLAFETQNPGGYGRIICDEVGCPTHIVEEKDATESERATTLCYGGILVGKRALLADFVAQLAPSPVTHEYYITHCVAFARQKGGRVGCITVSCNELLGVNTAAHLSAAEKVVQARLRNRALEQGVRMDDPDTVYLGYNTRFGSGVHVRPFVVIEPNVYVGDGCTIGPFANVRAGTHLGNCVRVGNFVEIKKSHLDYGVKVAHLAYVGDAVVHPNVNFGAGSVTCNFDGAHKHTTTVEEGAFIGSNTALVAPVRIGARATVAAGSVIVHDVAPDSLSIARARQVEKLDYVRS